MKVATMTLPSYSKPDETSMVVMIWVIGWKFPPGSRVSLVSAPGQGCHVCDSLTHLELTEAIRLGRFKPYAGVSSPPVRQLLHWLLEPLNTPG